MAGKLLVVARWRLLRFLSGKSLLKEHYKHNAVVFGVNLVINECALS